MRVTVTVRPKDGILDPQGEALRRSLAGLGHAVSAVHAGKVFDLEIDAADEHQALAIADQVAAQVLTNTLIERYELAAGSEAAA